MNAPAFPPNPTVGEQFQQFVWNGASWVCAPATGVQVLTKVFTASGPYMPSPGLVSVVVECIGGGGGGGGCATLDATLIITGGAGGSGGYSRKTLPASLVAGGVSVTVGAGGLGGGDGQNGVATTFGALCVANGGGLGQGNNDVTGFGAAGAEAPPGVGDVALPGNGGMNGVVWIGTARTVSVQSPMGGSMWGGTRTVNVPPQGAANGAEGYANTGAGGGGGVCNTIVPSGNIIGGNGGSGICIVTEYCWADVVPGEDCFPTGAARVAIGWQNDC